MGTGVKSGKTGIFAAAAVLTLLSGPVHSQDNPDSKVVVDPDSLPQNKELDRRYHEILNRQPDGKDSHDPWGNVRASETKPKPKDDKKHSATGTTVTK